MHKTFLQSFSRSQIFRIQGISSRASISLHPLVTALDIGWEINKVELVPSWDQHGFLYIITLHHSPSNTYQQYILPKNNQVEDLLEEITRIPCNIPQTDIVELIPGC